MYNQLKKSQQTKVPIGETSFALFKKSSSILIAIYLIYLGKSALGLNLSSNYSAPQFLKVPFKTIDCFLPIEGNYCHKSKQDVSLNVVSDL